MQKRFLEDKVDEEIHRGASRTTSAPTTARSTRCARCLQKQAASRRYSTARASFIAAARTCLPRSRLGGPGDSQMSTRWKSTTKKALHASLQLPAVLGRRDGPHGRHQPPRSATAHSPKKRSRRYPPRRKSNFPYTIRLVSECLASTAQPRWARSAHQRSHSWTAACRLKRRLPALRWAHDAQRQA
jgi:hypothetical protein